MSHSHPHEPLVHNVGGGDLGPLRFITDGQIRLLINGDGVIEFPSATQITAPAAGRNKAQLFFRLDENSKWQFCVQFPSGVFQVLATEP